MSIPISFEFFPPRTDAGFEKLRAARQQLYRLRPEFCSVTYGAGGSTRAGTFTTVREMVSEGMDTASHLSCIGTTHETVLDQLGRLKRMGVRRLVALRGDLPSGFAGGGEFQYASDLVEFVRAKTGDDFHISVACYPEVHPEAESPRADLEALRIKVEAGSDVAITQMFFNADAYFHFVDEVRACGLDIPIVPGIMPITSSSGLLRFASNCGAEVPRWLRLRLQGLGDDQQAIADFGADVVAQLCERLIAGGAPSLHFYTINRAEPTQRICERLSLGAESRAPAPASTRAALSVAHTN